MGKVITYGNEARHAMLSGMVKLLTAVASTLGPRGHTVVLDSGNNHPIATKDGVSVAKFVDLSNPYERIGSSWIKEAATKTDAIAGDGTTTTCVLSVGLCKAGNSLVDTNLDSVEIRKGFDKACEDIINALDSQKIIATTPEDIKHVATISANNDEEMGEFVKEAFLAVGEGGVVNAIGANNRSGKTTITVTTGMEISKGLVSGLFINTDSNTCEFENPSYLIVGKPIKNISDIKAIIQITNRANKPIVICAPVFEEGFMTEFLEGVEKGTITGALIYPNGHDRVTIDQFIEDLAVQVGAKVLEGKSKISIDQFNPNTMLGSSERIVISKTKTVITAGAGTDEEITRRIEEIQAEINKGMNGNDDETKTLNDIKLLQERIANLSGGVATIHIGARTPLELQEKKDRYEDAIRAVNAALVEGVIAGGGAGLLHAVKIASDNHKTLSNPTQEHGYQTFLSVCEQPAKLIIDSTGKKGDYIIEKIKESNNINYGYDAKKEVFSDTMYESGIIDPLLVTKTALLYSNSIAGTFITTDCVITNEFQNITVIPNDPLLDEDRGML